MNFMKSVLKEALKLKYLLGLTLLLPLLISGLVGCGSSTTTETKFTDPSPYTGPVPPGPKICTTATGIVNQYAQDVNIQADRNILLQRFAFDKGLCGFGHSNPSYDCYKFGLKGKIFAQYRGSTARVEFHIGKMLGGYPDPNNPLVGNINEFAPVQMSMAVSCVENGVVYTHEFTSTSNQSRKFLIYIPYESGSPAGSHAAYRFYYSSGSGSATTYPLFGTATVQALR